MMRTPLIEVPSIMSVSSMSSSTKFIITGGTDNCNDDDVFDEQLLTNGGEYVDVFHSIFAEQLNE